jgi:hypothetical protein
VVLQLGSWAGGQQSTTVKHLICYETGKRASDQDGFFGELHNLYSSPDIIRHIKSRRMRWTGHVARMGEGRKVYRGLVGKNEGKDHLKDQGVDGRMGSKWTLETLVGGCKMDSPGSG